MTVEIICFHTCDNRGGKEFILENVPFKSNSGKTEWLGVGYYFWTDSDYYAHKWGKISPRHGKYVITKFVVTVNKNDFLDLVGNVEDQLLFKKLLLEYKKTLDRILSKSNHIGSKSPFKENKNICVSSIINHYKKSGCFRFKVVKASDSPSNRALPFVTGKKEVLLSPTRQQLVVYEESLECIGKPELHFSKPPL